MSVSLNVTKFAFRSIALAFALSIGGADAQEINSTQILDALMPPKTRRLTIGPSTSPPAKSSDEKFLDGLRDRPSQAFSASDRIKLSSVLPGKPQIDLPMEFDRNSAALRGKTLQNADNLGRALANEAMKGQTIVIAGHTDAKGSDALNQELSERRAEAVKQLLVRQYGIPAANLIAVGYGKTNLKNPRDPLGHENRRVQTVNVTTTNTASIDKTKQ